MVFSVVQVTCIPQKASGKILPSKRRTGVAKLHWSHSNPHLQVGCATEARCSKGLETAVPGWLCLIWAKLWYYSWWWFLDKHFRYMMLQHVTLPPKNQKPFHCLGFCHYFPWGKWRAGCLACALESLFCFVFCFFVPKLKWREGESQVGMDTWHTIKHGILVLCL